MTRLSDLTRDMYGHADDHEVPGEADEYELCTVCGEPFDRRILHAAMYHFETDDHERLHTWH